MLSIPGARSPTSTGYSETVIYSYNGRKPELRPDASHLFFVESGEGLALFVVHDQPGDLDGGNAVMQFKVGGDADNEVQILLRDDPFSQYDAYNAGLDGKSFVSWHRWFSCCTVGLVLGPLERKWQVWTHFPERDKRFGDFTIGGITSWVAVSTSGSAIPLKLEKGRRVLLEPVSLMAKKKETRWCSLGHFG